MKKIETTTDATLVRQYLDGSEDALSKLINRHQQRIYNFIFSKVLIEISPKISFRILLLKLFVRLNEVNTTKKVSSYLG